MSKRGYFSFVAMLLLLIAFVIAPVPASTVLAASVNTEATTSDVAQTTVVPSVTAEADNTQQIQHVYDNAGLLSTKEVKELESMCTTYGKDAGIQIMILTHDDEGAAYAEDYIETFEDKLPAADRVYLLADMAHRQVFIEGYGSAETYINSDRINTIVDEITPFMSNGKYYEAFATYIKRSAEYMKDDSNLNYNHDYSYGTPQSDNPNAANYDETWQSNQSNQEVTDVLSNVWVQLLIALIIGAVSVAIMAYHSGGRMTVNGNNYIDPNHSGLIGRRDDYLRTTVTRVRKPENNNNSGGGGFNSGGFRGGVSDGGRSHSSGGGSF